jgi:cellulose synthase/poly-beta-1,6-N-acetylglucosamine synthase-like glycosyltransferase
MQTDYGFMLANIIIVVAIVASALIAILHVPYFYLAIIHLRWARRAVAREHASLAVADSPAEIAPLICVQLPIFNEVQAGAAINAVCSLDWPTNKLEILVLDDSDVAIRAVAESLVAEWRARGINAKHIWRGQRDEYKAGALAEGMRHTAADYIAIFDVDYRPHRNFLRGLMKALDAMPIAAFVQARLDYFNRDRNLLTRAQALQLDIYFAYEQLGRAWAGIPTPFNGTCAIWRREAIERAGGWSGRSLLEDLDLSLRAFAQGWRSINLVSVTAAGELPVDFATLLTQRQRWAIGSGQSFRLMPWALLRRLSLRSATLFVLLAIHQIAVPVLVPAALLAALFSWLLESKMMALAEMVATAAVLVPVAARSLAAYLASRAVSRRLGAKFLLDLAAMLGLEALLLPLTAKSHLVGMFRRHRLTFARTPKRGS